MDTELHPDERQVDLIFQMMRTSVSTEGDTDDAKCVRYLVKRGFARAVSNGERAIATLEGVKLLRRYYNSMSIEQAVEQHLQVLLQRKKEREQREQFSFDCNSGDLVIRAQIQNARPQVRHRGDGFRSIPRGVGYW